MPQNYMQNMPMMYNPYGYYAPNPAQMYGYTPPMPTAQPYPAYQAPNFDAVQQRMETQRKQAEAFFKKMREQHQAQLATQQPKNTIAEPAVKTTEAKAPTAETKPEAATKTDAATPAAVK